MNSARPRARIPVSRIIRSSSASRPPVTIVPSRVTLGGNPRIQPSRSAKAARLMAEARERLPLPMMNRFAE
jgi:hypothetical protein